MSVLQKLTEGIIQRDVSREGQALLNKWEQTGLLEGLGDDRQKQGMAVLLENQAKELLREASSMAAGDVEGFAAVAFPIVRRVFGGLIANDLVSVQPMSLPSGLIFFLDFTHESGRLGAGQNESVYGGNVVGRQITGGVDLGDAQNVGGGGGFYNFGNAYSHPTGSSVAAADALITDAGAAVLAESGSIIHNAGGQDIATMSRRQMKAVRFDADILSQEAGRVRVAAISGSLVDTIFPDLDKNALHGIQMDVGTGQLIRRLTRFDANGNLLLTVVTQTATDPVIGAGVDVIQDVAAGDFTYPKKDRFIGGNAQGLGSVVGSDPWGLEEPEPSTGNTSRADGAGKTTIAEIDIKVDSVAVTATTKKLKAKWTPELGQDLNAYHNLDAEVELTGILSEQIALEIDRELLNELVVGATAGTRYWSRAPGLFLDSNGNQVGANTAAPDFTGTVSEWYETLIETINDVSAQIHRKTLRGGANFVVCSPEVANILEFTSGFRASVTADQDRGTIGAVKAGSLSKKFDVYVDPYFLRNVILVGRKGSSFLESGFVYAPYVPLQVTPTIFGTEDFVPRKGVMTRYAKKMVRPDMYGLVVVSGLLGEEG